MAYLIKQSDLDTETRIKNAKEYLDSLKKALLNPALNAEDKKVIRLKIRQINGH